jgi:hypothetical protein
MSSDVGSIEPLVSKAILYSKAAEANS